MAKIGDLFLGLDVETADFKSKLQKAATEGGQVAGKGFSDKLNDAVNKGTVVAGAAVGTFVAAGIQDFARFQHGMNEVFTLLPGITKDAMGAMEDDVKSFANATGVLPDEVIPALYNALSAGVPPDNVFAFLEDANKLAVAGATDVNTAVGALTSVTNAYGRDVLSAADASDILFTGVRMGKTTIDELSAAMSTVAPMAANLGVGLDEVVSSMAAMTSQGEPTTGAATKLRGVMAELSVPASTLGKVFTEIAGKTFPEFVAGGGTLGEALTMIREHADKTGVGVNTLTGNMEAGMALMMLTSGQGAAQVGANMDAMADRTGAVDQAFQTMDTGVAATTRKIVAQIKTFAISIGEEFQALGPLFTAFGPTMGRLLGAGLGAAGGLVVNALRSMFAGMIPLLLGHAAATGTATGTAQGNAHVAAATGQGIITKMVAGIAAMSIPGAAAGTTVGTAVGSAMGLALTGAVVTGGAVALHSLVNSAEWKQGVKEVSGGIVDPQVLDDTWTHIKERAKQGGQEAGQAGAQGFIGPMELLGPHLSEVGGRGLRRTFTDFIGIARVGGDAVAEGYRQAVERRDAARAYNIAWGRTMADALSKYQGEAWEGGQDVAGSYSDAVQDSRSTLRQAWQRFLDAMKDPISAAEDMAWVHGKLTGEKLAQGLRSSDPRIRDAARAQQQLLRVEYRKLLGEMYQHGMSAMERFAQGMRDRIGLARAAARDAAGAVGRYMELRSPAKEGPFSRGGGPEGWGYRFGDLWVRGLQHSPLNNAFTRLMPAMAMPAMTGISGNLDHTIRHVVELDGQNLPPGVTNEGVARIVYEVIAREASGASLRWND